LAIHTILPKSVAASSHPGVAGGEQPKLTHTFPGHRLDQTRHTRSRPTLGNDRSSKNNVRDNHPSRNNTNRVCPPTTLKARQLILRLPARIHPPPLQRGRRREVPVHTRPVDEWSQSERGVQSVSSKTL